MNTKIRFYGLDQYAHDVEVDVILDLYEVVAFFSSIPVRPLFKDVDGYYFYGQEVSQLPLRNEIKKRLPMTYVNLFRILN